MLRSINGTSETLAPARGVKEYNELTGRLKRIEDQQTKKVFDYSLLTNEELLQLIQLLEKCVVNSSMSSMKSVYTSDLEIEDKP
ncbi:MAG: hypothetical protein IT249_09910 [Chitinophagaceae bacterium]|nr:hypothetical protein [Chitinophagaceae bacterium]